MMKSEKTPVKTYFDFMCEMTGYVPSTTFWQDFSIAECYGRKAIKDTFRKAFNQWKSNYVYLTELVVILNWKIWSWYEENGSIAELYNDLYEQADQYAINNLKDEELQYFLKTVD